jgi:hypothetical protein
LGHFDWSIGSNNFAQISIDRSVAHTGSRSLKIAFAGMDTTRLDEEVNQFILVEPGGNYRLECYVKTKDLISPEGPRVVLNAINSKVTTSLAASNAAASGTNDWQPLIVDFTVPGDAKTIKLNVKRTPKFSYDDPTQGVVWFDDFILTKRGGGK